MPLENNINLSIIIPIYNESIFIHKLFDQILEHFNFSNIEILFIDDGSLDGTNEINATVDKTNYTDKNFVYFSIDQNIVLDREPISQDWDITFTKYIMK